MDNALQVIENINALLLLTQQLFNRSRAFQENVANGLLEVGCTAKSINVEIHKGDTSYVGRHSLGSISPDVVEGLGPLSSIEIRTRRVEGSFSRDGEEGAGGP